MVSEAVTSHPKNVHPLRSRLVFFLRDWSLTLFLLPLFLLGWSFWMLPLIAASIFADSRLQKLYEEYDRSAEAGFEWGSVKRLQIQLWGAVLAAVLLATAAYGLGGASYAIFAPAIAFAVSKMYDPRSSINWRGYADNEPVYKGQIPYPGIAVFGPRSLIGLSEFARVFSIWWLFAASLSPTMHPMAPFFAGALGLLTPVCYWIGARIVALNDELRMLKSKGDRA
jgi:hypothetical protein